jgi:hypothetical protein
MSPFDRATAFCRVRRRRRKNAESVPRVEGRVDRCGMIQRALGAFAAVQQAGEDAGERPGARRADIVTGSPTLANRAGSPLALRTS